MASEAEQAPLGWPPLVETLLRPPAFFHILVQKYPSPGTASGTRVQNLESRI